MWRSFMIPRTWRYPGEPRMLTTTKYKVFALYQKHIYAETQEKTNTDTHTNILPVIKRPDIQSSSSLTNPILEWMYADNIVRLWTTRFIGENKTPQDVYHQWEKNLTKSWCVEMWYVMSDWLNVGRVILAGDRLSPHGRWCQTAISEGVTMGKVVGESDWDEIMNASKKWAVES